MLRVDLFHCGRATFNQWAQSVLSQNAITRGNLEIAMPAFAALDGLALADFGLLMSALEGLPAEAAFARALNAVRPIDTPLNDPGRPSLVAALQDHVVRTFEETDLAAQAMALERWAALADEYHGVEDSVQYLNARSAAAIHRVCQTASAAGTTVYAHALVDVFHGFQPAAARAERLAALREHHPATRRGHD